MPPRREPLSAAQQAILNRLSDRAERGVAVDELVEAFPFTRQQISNRLRGLADRKEAVFRPSKGRWFATRFAPALALEDLNKRCQQIVRAVEASNSPLSFYEVRWRSTTLATQADLKHLSQLGFLEEIEPDRWQVPPKP